MKMIMNTKNLCFARHYLSKELGGDGFFLMRENKFQTQGQLQLQWKICKNCIGQMVAVIVEYLE